MKRSPEQWLALFQAHETSGLSQARFCKEHQLCPKYFSLRKRQLAETSRASFVKVQKDTVSKVTADIRLCYRDVNVYVPASSIPFITALVKALA